MYGLINNDCNNARLDCEELCVSSCANSWGFYTLRIFLLKQDFNTPNHALAAPTCKTQQW